MHRISQFTDFANQVIGVYQINAKRIIEAYQGFSVQFSAFAIGANLTWPFVTLPAFEAQVDALVEQTGAKTMGVVHLVSEEDRPEWEKYTIANQGWIQESLDFRGSNETAPPIVPHIWNSFSGPDAYLPAEGIAENFDSYAPLWQSLNFWFITNFDLIR